MRRRSRHTSTNSEPPDWPAPTVDDAATTQSDATLDAGLRALAKLLARQAAREVFEQECALQQDRLTLNATPETPEDLQ